MSNLRNKTKDYSNLQSNQFLKNDITSHSNNSTSYTSQKLPSSLNNSQLNKYYFDTLSTPPLSSSVAYQSSNKLSSHSDEQKLISKSIAISRIGLHNLGNTCFMNTCLQNLIHTDVFIERLMNLKNSINYQTPITKRFYELCTMMASALSPLSPTEFKKAFGQRHNTFQGYGQHDTQEFCRVFLEDISLELNTVKAKPKYVELKTDNMSKKKKSQAYDELFRKRENSIIIDTFYGQIINVFTCPCKYETYSYGKVLDIPLLLPPNDRSVSLNRLLDSYFETEMIQWESKCVKCNKKTIQEKKASFAQLPEVLILSFQRNNGRIKRKNNIEISFDEEIDMKEYIDDECVMNSRTRYELYGVGNHSGTMDFGHYYAQIKIDGTWLEFNDSTVSNCYNLKKLSSLVYVLFYRNK